MVQGKTKELHEKLVQLERRVSALDYALHRTNQVLSRNFPDHLDALMEALDRDIRIFNESQNPIAEEMQDIVSGLDHLKFLSDLDRDQSV